MPKREPCLQLHHASLQCKIGWCHADDDVRLKEAVAANTGADGDVSWVGVAADMPGRTDNQVMRRWKQVSKGPKAPNCRCRLFPFAVHVEWGCGFAA